MWQDDKPKRRKLEEQLAADLRQQYGDGKGSAPTAPAPAPTTPH